MSKIPEILRVARTGKYKTFQCVADASGVTRQRAHQVLREHEEFDDFGRSFRMEWDCNDCGVQISLQRYELRKIVHQPAVCRKCAADYCMSGRHRFSKVGYHKRTHGCKVCIDEWEQKVVETRTCKGCSQPIKVSRLRLGMINAPSSSHTGEWHAKCWNASGLSSSRKSP